MVAGVNFFHNLFRHKGPEFATLIPVSAVKTGSSTWGCEWEGQEVTWVLMATIIVFISSYNKPWVDTRDFKIGTTYTPHISSLHSGRLRLMKPVSQQLSLPAFTVSTVALSNREVDIGPFPALVFNQQKKYALVTVSQAHHIFIVRWKGNSFRCHISPPAKHIN